MGLLRTLVQELGGVLGKERGTPSQEFVHFEAEVRLEQPEVLETPFDNGDLFPLGVIGRPLAQHRK